MEANSAKCYSSVEQFIFLPVSHNVLQREMEHFQKIGEMRILVSCLKLHNKKKPFICKNKATNIFWGGMNFQQIEVT